MFINVFQATKIRRIYYVFFSILVCALIVIQSSISEARNNGSAHLIMGTPSAATTDPTNEDDYLLIRRQYALSYNNSKRIANWVSWQLNSFWLGSVDRCSSFSPDPDLPKNFVAVRPNDYTGSGFSRGHMTRSGDRSRSTTDNCATFFMTNILPQTQDNNGGPWLQLEDLSRDLAQKGNELYIIAGGNGKGGTGTKGFATEIGKNKVTVPATLWKIVVVLDRPGLGNRGVTEKTRVIAVNMPNIVGIQRKSYTDYLTTVDELEKLTGYDFLSDVPEDVQKVIEAKEDR
ncbi:DNA/RNA non-specific endonuclease [Leptolyngbya sp. FACHB-17]|uniref:DNA/RNA non-specific endonuclease n=1 Tax=unclassified Leptolyngbya TaxID=2650499 RepID=UPI0016815018|nr:DNA/RNA non-specific endonuclease [Leptolyngbya sp. FACHB-17]MBD2078447.1 DNA/RNA non-specific endonuclease [Leptolyngbya sp. FACHB-17]